MPGLPDATTINAFGDLPLTLAVILLAIIEVMVIGGVVLLQFLSHRRQSELIRDNTAATKALMDEQATRRQSDHDEAEKNRALRERELQMQEKRYEQAQKAEANFARALGVLTAAQDALMSRVESWGQTHDQNAQRRYEGLRQMLSGISDTGLLTSTAIETLHATVIQHHDAMREIHTQQHAETVGLLRELMKVLSDQLAAMRPEDAVLAARELLIEVRDSQRLIYSKVEEIWRQKPDAHTTDDPTGPTSARAGGDAGSSADARIRDSHTRHGE